MPILSGAQPALTSSRVKVLRLGAGRLGWIPLAQRTRLTMTIGGVSAQTRMRVTGLSIRDLLNDAPNTCSFVVDTTAPTVGQDVKIGLGSLDVSSLLFAGTIESVDQLYEGGRAVNRAWTVTCQDYMRAINKRKVRKRYAQQSATAIALDLITNYTSGFTTSAIVAGLPTVTGGIDYTEEDVGTCLTRLASRIGGYWYVDYVKNVHLFLEEPSASPDPLVLGSTTLMNDPPVTQHVDLSQIRTRVYVEGGGSTARVTALAGATTLQVTDASWYSGTGGVVVSGPQRIAYTGKGIVGGPTAPSGAQSLVAGNLDGGPYTYKVTQVDSGVEMPLSVASAPVTIDPILAPTTGTSAVDGPVTPPPVKPNVGSAQSGGALGVGVYTYGFTFVTTAGETTPSPLDTGTTTSGFTRFNVTNIAVGPAGTTGRKLYRSSVGGGAGTLRLVANLTDNTTTSFNDGNTDVSLGVLAPTVNTAGGGVMTTGAYSWMITFLTAAGQTLAGAGTTLTVTAGKATLTVPVSADPRVTGRRIFRTKVGGSTYFDEGTLANNTATTFASILNDSSLGAAYSGVYTAGAPGKITVSSIATGGGTVTARRLYRTVAGGTAYKLVAVIADNVTVSYLDNVGDGSLGAAASGDTVTQLTGIPASGAGSIQNDILTGDGVNLLVQCDDVPAQVALAAMDGTDGIVEHYIQDRRLAEAQARATGNADLALFSRPIVTIRYASRDPKTRSGKTVHVDLLASLGLPIDDYTIQSVTIDEIGVAVGVWPRYTVEASSVRFSLEDVLRRLALD